MTDIEAPFRRATPEDAAALAELINLAGERLPVYLWERMAEPGETVWEVGRRRARREDGSFSYCNAVVAEVDGQAIALMIGYRLPDSVEPIGEDMPAMFVPLQELENLAAGTWYLNVLAAYPEQRGRGFGTHLIRIAEGLAAESNARGTSIIVSDGNPDAWRLYRRLGYVERAQRPMVKDAWVNPGENWVLLVKERQAEICTIAIASFETPANAGSSG